MRSAKGTWADSTPALRNRSLLMTGLLHLHDINVGRRHEIKCISGQLGVRHDVVQMNTGGLAESVEQFEPPRHAVGKTDIYMRETGVAANGAGTQPREAIAIIKRAEVECLFKPA